jgi:MFS family permease
VLRLIRSPAQVGPSGAPSWWPAGYYYGWALVVTLGVTATVSYGVLSYAFSVFIDPMTRELGWSKATVTGAFSLGSLVMGLAAIPVGRWVDRHGARAVMTMGASVAALLLVAWSRVQSIAAFYAIWAVMGVALAAVLYEPAFAVIATWFRVRRARALTVLTFIGGFASVIFVPLATWLVTAHGWRTALLWLAALYAPLTILPHAVVLRRRPEDLGLVPDGSPITDPGAAAEAGTVAPERSIPAVDALRTRSFRWVAMAFALSSFTATAVAIHLVPLLLERGYRAAFAGTAMGVLGLMALPGRLVFTPLGSRWPRSGVTAALFALQAVACFALLAMESTMAVWVFVLFFGVGSGAITPARAALVAELYGPAHYGKIAGVLAFLVSLARAAAPVGASWLYALGGASHHGYNVVLGVLLALCIGAGATVLLAGDGEPVPVPAKPQSTAREAPA